MLIPLLSHHYRCRSVHRLQAIRTLGYPDNNDLCESTNGSVTGSDHEVKLMLQKRNTERSKTEKCPKRVPEGGVEPPRPCGH